MTLSIMPIEGIGEAVEGDDVAGMLVDGLAASDLVLEDRDVLVVTHKLVSKAEGRVIELEDAGPDGHRYLVEEEAAAIVRRRGHPGHRRNPSRVRLCECRGRPLQCGRWFSAIASH